VQVPSPVARTKRMRHPFFKLLFLCLAFGISSGLDVSLEHVVCDSTLPVTADLYMQCNSTGARCTFGDVVNLYGTSKLVRMIFITPLSFVIC
jgi:hypothetical protein